MNRHRRGRRGARKTARETQKKNKRRARNNGVNYAQLCLEGRRQKFRKKKSFFFIFQTPARQLTAIKGNQLKML